MKWISKRWQKNGGTVTMISSIDADNCETASDPYEFVQNK